MKSATRTVKIDEDTKLHFDFQDMTLEIQNSTAEYISWSIYKLFNEDGWEWRLIEKGGENAFKSNSRNLVVRNGILQDDVIEKQHNPKISRTKPDIVRAELQEELKRQRISSNDILNHLERCWSEFRQSD